MMILFLFIFSFHAFSQGQQEEDPVEIKRIEYFINTDPGVGKAIQVPVALNTEITRRIDNINVSHLPEGIHRISVRTLDNEGVWSITQTYTFLRVKMRVRPDIVLLEYFIDDDPGFGNATKVNIAQEGQVPDISELVNILVDGINSGIHTLYIRAKDKTGRWSITQQRTFQLFYQEVSPDLTGLEYFIDVDPGFGKGSFRPLSGQTGIEQVAVDISDVKPGFHKLYVRSRNVSRHWSITQISTFIKTEIETGTDVADVEYFVDKDPGFGEGKKVNITAGKNVTAYFPVNPDTLKAGIHTLYVRAKNSNGRWSLVQSLNFMKFDQQAVADVDYLEYFIDKDPGFGEATNIPITPGGNVIKPFTIVLPDLADGFHRLYVRARNTSEKWSITQSQAFIKTRAFQSGKITGLEWFIDTDPGFDNAESENIQDGDTEKLFNVNIDVLNNGLHTLYIRTRDEDGQWSITQDIPFIKMEQEISANIIAYEYFIDKDPGFGMSDTYITITPGHNIKETFTVNISSLENGLHTLYVRVLDDQGVWSVTQYQIFLKTTRPTRSDLVAMEYFIDSDPGFGSGIPVGISGTSATHAFILDVASLSEGLHTLYVRALDDKKQWSITQDVTFNIFKDEREIDDIVEVEWFLDTDPGFGNAPSSQRFTYSTPQRTVIQPFAVDIETLPLGWHTLYVRAKNEKGNWSITQTQSFLKIKSRDIETLEYFIDHDKGFGNNNNIPITPGTEITTTLKIPTSTLEDGIHTLYVRGLNKAGDWGITQLQSFIKITPTRNIPDINLVEYFVDTDPGFGKGTPVNISNTANGQALIPINGNEYGDGTHTLYIRTQNTDKTWSITHSIQFLSITLETIPNVVAAEWFIDKDPGFGEATPVPFPNSGTHVTHTFNIPLTSSIKEGVHTLYIRARTQTGIWSITGYKTFYKVTVPENANLQQLEYFIDNDPGVGKAEKIALSQQKNTEKSFTVSLDNLSTGFHTLYIRSQNTSGKWSITQSKQILISEIPDDYQISDVIALEWFIDSDPGIGSANKVLLAGNEIGQNTSKTFAVDISSIGPGLHTFYVRAVNSKNRWSITHRQTFIKSDSPTSGHELADVVRLEYFINIDPGFGEGIPVSLPESPNTGTAFDVNLDELANGTHTLYIRALDKNGKWGHTQSFSFVRVDIPVGVNNNVVYLEYFIDNDPGLGKAKSIPITPGQNIIVNNFFISLEDIWFGLHQLYIRARDERGFWSIMQMSEFFVVDNPRIGGYPDIVALEYFFDDDPGFGQATGVDIPNKGINVSHRFFVDVDAIPEGMHILYIRGKNSQGQWSQTQDISIYRMEVPQFEGIKSIVGFEYFIDTDPGFGEANFIAALIPDQSIQQSVTVDVNTLSEGIHTVYVRAVDETGVWSHTQHYSFVRIQVKPLSPVTALEWFIDKDPGFGKASKINITSGTSVTRNFNVSIPDTIKPGFHSLYVRSLNEDKLWSVTHSINFAIIQIRKIPGLTELEYFIDEDPGFGEAISIPITQGSMDEIKTATIPLAGVNEGLHILYVRAKNEEEAWSITQYMPFTVVKIVRDVKITALEYFIDSDPGFGEATSISISPSTTIDKTFPVDIDAEDPGLHNLYIRARDENNKWSITQDITFIKLEEIKDAKIVKAEYYIDDLKEFGAGTDIPVTEGKYIQEVVSVNTSTLLDGIHTVFVRVKDDQGIWSITQYQQFVKQSKHVPSATTALEWFIDNDPGFGRGEPVPVTSGTMNFPVNLAAFSPGLHTLYIRAKNSQEDWSITHDITFIKLDEDIFANIIAYEWFINDDPGFGQATSYTEITPAQRISRTVTVDISSLAEGIHTMFVRVLDDNNTWSITQSQSFMKVKGIEPGKITGLEWFIDTDPGMGNATPVEIQSGQTEKLFIIDLTSLTNGMHTLYVRARDVDGKWSITQDITFISLDERTPDNVIAYEYFIDKDPGFGKASGYTSVTPAQKVTRTFTVNTSGLDDGLHTLYIRALNEGKEWSITQSQTFIKTTRPKDLDLISLEYFFDTDPGFGAGIPVALWGTNATNSFSVDVSTLNEGLHTLYIRGQNSDKKWSITQDITFLLFNVNEISDIVEVEWFVDTDPGFGNVPSEQRFEYSTPQHTIVRTFPVNTENLSLGLHHLYVRAKNERDAWSITQHHSFMKVKSQSVEALEYFIDTDKGFGKNTIIPIATPGANVSATFNVPTQDLGDGIHTLYVRGLNEKGYWGITQYQAFIKVTPALNAADVNLVEYFIDTDPGFGEANRINVTPLDNGPVFIPVADNEYTEGAHIFYVRSRNTKGEWSITQSIPFLTIAAEIVPDVTALEWFIDEEPGFGQGIPVAIPEPGTHVIRTFNIPLSTVDDGLHTLYVRARTQTGIWSITQYRTFIKVSPTQETDLLQLEYFIDTDPGIGKAEKVALSSQKTADKSFTVSLDNVSPGHHTLYVRSQNTEKHWSITQSIQILVSEIPVIPDITAAEWFIDDDPGFESANKVLLLTNEIGQNVRKTFTVQLPDNTSSGLHTFYVRAKNAQNRWSHTQYSQFVKVEGAGREIPNAVALEYFIDKDPGFGKAVRKNISLTDNTVNISIDTVSAGIHTLYVRTIDADSLWSITHSIDFMKMEIRKVPKVTAIEWFIDEDPGFGEANDVTPVFTASQNVTHTFAVSLNGLNDGIHTFYVRAKDSLENWSITQYSTFIKSSVRLLPEVVAVEYFLDTDPGFGQGTQLPVTNANTPVSIMFTTDMITEGAHTLYVRTLNNKKEWSITQSIKLLVFNMESIEPSKVMALEYFIDNDPGFGNGKKINISPTSLDVSRKVTIQVADIADGIHTLYVRAMNEEEKWSITHYSIFLKVKAENAMGLPDITRIEYFFDTDPGVGLGNPISTSPDRNVDMFFDIDPSGLELDVIHTLYIRAISTAGKWSITHSFEFTPKKIPEEEQTGRPVGGSITPSSSEICENEDAYIRLTVVDYKSRILNWQQRHYDENGLPTSLDWTNIAGSIPSITVSPKVPGIWKYRAVITNGDREPVYSDYAEIKVIASAKGGFVTAEAMPEYLCSSKPIKLILEEYKGDVVKWQGRNTTVTQDWTDIPLNNDTIEVTPDAGGVWEYRALVAAGTCNDEFSKSLKVNVVDATTGGEILPDSISPCIGKTIELNARNYLGKIIRWQSSVDEGSTWSNIIFTEENFITTLYDKNETWFRAVVKAGNCDETYSEPAVITPVDKIEDAGEITGSDVVCAPTSVSVKYRVASIAGAEEYEWTVPAGAIIDGMSNTNEIQVHFPQSAQSGLVTVKGKSTTCGVGAPSELFVQVNQKPATPVITGPASVCVGQPAEYEVPAIPGAVYTWSLPVGWTGTSTSNTITVIPSGIGGTISVTVTAPNGCVSDEGTLDITVSQGTPTGPIYRLPNF
ncbi:MAG: hypothetical protein LBQ60_05775 [Bacteroidales bacterium]|jgi:hypothetical protein|nr:hypothetical protein [Bacteroidales bacterium]